ncbi:MAG: hypothetical protein KDE03_07480 [Rhodobacteraceae bacterium]|nr:hypothetical protein [Paracoccaceae bacterium]
MIFSSLRDFLNRGTALLAKGPVAMIFCEDTVEINSTVQHHLGLGFASVIVILPDAFEIPGRLEGEATWLRHNTTAAGALEQVVNAIAAVAPPATWLYYCYNAEYLFFPFCENRSVGEMLAFHAEERRDAMLAYVIDIYSGDLDRFPDAVDPKGAMLDRSGYYALGRKDRETGQERERQLDFFGGLRWRFEEHVPKHRRKIDRIALFRPQAGLMLRDDHTFNVEEYNTYACPWHHNITSAIVSFRTAKALRTNPGSRYDVHSFVWHSSVPFEWHSQQLMDLGLMEPGQWF